MHEVVVVDGASLYLDGNGKRDADGSAIPLLGIGRWKCMWFTDNEYTEAHDRRMKSTIRTADRK